MSNNLLFIDDENDILKNYMALFKEHMESIKNTNKREGPDIYQRDQFTIHTAISGEDGIEIVKKKKGEGDNINVCFVDMRMPGLSGLETIKKIHDFDSKVEIVIVTAHFDESIGNILKTVGEPEKFLYLKKPFHRYEIIQLARNLTEKYYNNSIKDNFISNVSHELKTPLSSILGFHQLIEEMEDLSEEGNEFLTIIGKNARLMQSLVQDLITAVELRRKQFILHKEEKSLKEILRSTYQIMVPILKEYPDIDYLFEPCEEDAMLFIDESRFKKCVISLINNSIKFTDKGFIKIRSELVNGEAVITVSDSGIGIEKDKLEYIFEHFNRIENEHHEKPGLGLGLNITKEIILAHDGRVTVESEISKGSDFKIILPTIPK
ncbi:ATP-binding protein [Bacteriovoracales bacterium]|nr:ATP-binding protein [Bacteriovoracales bacterium]